MVVSGTSMICVLAYNALYVYTLTSIYLQLAFILIGRAAETLHEGSREISVDGQKENLPENLLNMFDAPRKSPVFHLFL